MQIHRPQNEGILVLDFGSQYTLLIARRLRECGIYAEVIDGNRTTPPPDFRCRGIILSGGPDSVTEEGSRRLGNWVWDLKVPVLGICYGLQLLVEHFGGHVRSATKREYGKATLVLKTESGPAAKIFADLPPSQTVWMSHGDDTGTLPECLVALGHTAHDHVTAAIIHRQLPIAALQFHPEVQHSDHGAQILTQFARNLCGIEANWNSRRMVDLVTESIRDCVGNGRVLMAVSGGVDSTVAAALLGRALGPEKVTAVLIDHGLMRKGETTWVKNSLLKAGFKDLHVLHRPEQFLNALSGVSDPEAKRKIIGRCFIEEFEKFAPEHGPFTHLGQGTLYPDVIESAGHGSGAKVIKTHHNVGGLPAKLALQLVEPFRFLFKDEVRLIGRELGLPKELVDRHPFPGPGMAVRLLGDITGEKLALLREADAIFIEELRNAGLYDQVWQAFVVLLPVRSVGVMGDNRTYQWTIALRSVSSTDGMTADVSDLPLSFLKQVASRIVRQVPGINRVTYDITTKPPATIEWE